MSTSINHMALTIAAKFGQKTGIMRRIRSITSLLALLLLSLGAEPTVAATDQAMLHAREGVAALLRGKYDKAIEAYSLALKSPDISDARRANIYNDRGVAKWRLRKAKDAIRDFNKAIELFPEYAVVYNNRGNALMDLRRPDEAIKDFARAIDLAPAYGAAHNNRGNALHAMGRFEEAGQAYRKAIELMPTNAVAFNGRGRMHSVLERPHAALRDFSRAITLNARYTSAYRNRGATYTALERPLEAVKDYTQALSGPEKDIELFLARARAHVRGRAYGAAIKDLGEVIKLDPENAVAHGERGAAYAKLRNFKRSLDDLTKAVSLDPKYVLAYSERALAYLRMKKLDEALADATRALAIEPRNVTALLARGQIREALKQPVQALADFETALIADPKQKDARAAVKRLTGEDPPPPAPMQALSEPMAEWTVYQAGQRKYVAKNPKHPRLEVPLEMHGAGTPKLIEWEVQSKPFRGIGVLKYDAGVSKAAGDKRMVYAAVVDTRQNRLVSIEPLSWGEKKSNWSWVEGSLKVKDPDGVTNEIKLRKAPPKRPAQGQPWYSSEQNARRLRQERRARRRQNRQGGGIFNWLFGN